ncbi:hypothetical protein FRAHR75_1890006 [Frankia sp. Hr75.2]|nr:hypothetical protein FRAHR75_1890006 [Frankia sp. Hr75.2]
MVKGVHGRTALAMVTDGWGDRDGGPVIASRAAAVVSYGVERVGDELGATGPVPGTVRWTALARLH